ncbi:hypothetical protein NAH03_24120, partial [Stenotrophomonas maltophilia]|uniref:DedA family protein n=1 Tax=Stenotrophomonas maltophilia TaxID=40324 RepID=UPI0031C347FC|nr:hypothetical protein [Stenotrophomonas maltophilia]
PFPLFSFLPPPLSLLAPPEHALHQHSMITILICRFVLPTRPLVPMVAGMLYLPVANFVLPNIIGFLLWPPLYFLPGILAGAAIDIPADENSASFKWLLLGAALLAWLAGWLCWRLWRSAKTSGDRLTRWLPRGRLLWLSPLMVALAATALTFVFRHPLMPVYLAILHKVIAR